MSQSISNLLISIKKQFFKNNKRLRGLGVVKNNQSVYLYFTSENNLHQTMNLAKSSDGLNFELFRKDLRITNYKVTETVEQTSNWHFTNFKKYFLLTYRKKTGSKIIFGTATTSDLIKFEYNYFSPYFQEERVLVPNMLFQKGYLAYGSIGGIDVFTSKDLKQWQTIKTSVLVPRPGRFDSGPLEVVYISIVNKGILVLYHSVVVENNEKQYRLGAALFDKNNPSLLLWRAADPIWVQSSDWSGKKVYPIGAIDFSGKIVSYWGVENEGIYAVSHSTFHFGDGVTSKTVSVQLQKAKHNPIISPNHKNDWESFNTFNPAALYTSDKVHLLYRAQGYNYISVLGYASSHDGHFITERHSKPAYIPQSPFFPVDRKKTKKISYGYVSGGGYGGCEDPRLTLIDNKIYMTYVAFDGYNPPRVALTSIEIEDFLNHRWLWERPVLISPPGVVDKNAVIFPEKINGKYVIFHRIYPDILIDFVDSLEFDGTSWLKGQYKISPRPTMWDSRKIGAGAPPIKTRDGWLLIYQSVGNQDPGKYKMGAMLLDLHDPTRVLYRSRLPILEPTATYENEGFKSGVVYPCGAVIIKDTLFVYYGGADSHVCVATAKLDEFLSELKYEQIARLEPAIISKVM